MVLARPLALLAVLLAAACAPVSPAGPIYGTPVAATGQVPPVAYGSYCQAGVYQCQLAQTGPVGSPCACPGIGAPSYGVIR